MLRLISYSATPVVSLAEMVEHLKRQDTDEDDALIQRYTKAAQLWAENFTGLALVDQTWDWYFDEFPDGLDPFGRFIRIPKPPLLEIEGVFYRNIGQGEFTSYSIDYAGNRIFLGQSASWPETDGAQIAGRIRFRAGYLDESSPGNVNEIPADIKAAIQLYTGSLYNGRDVDEASARVAPWGAEQLLRMYRVENSLA